MAENQVKDHQDDLNPPGLSQAVLYAEGAHTTSQRFEYSACALEDDDHHCRWNPIIITILSFFIFITLQSSTMC